MTVAAFRFRPTWSDIASYLPADVDGQTKDRIRARLDERDRRLEDHLDGLRVHLVPTGAVVTYRPAGTPPAGWLTCNGAAVSRTTFAPLFAAVGVLWGAGNGTTTFNVPTIADSIIKAV